MGLTSSKRRVIEMCPEREREGDTSAHSEEAVNVGTKQGIRPMQSEFCED